MALAVTASAHKSKRHYYGTNSDKNHNDDRKRTKVRVRAPYTAVDVNTKRRRVHIRVPYYNRVIRW
jgi:LmbE family N-acetylglucosaminyl deacetylase